MTNRTVLIVDDERDTADVLGLLLTGLGFRALVSYSGAEAIAIAGRERPDVAIIDLAMPEVCGLDVARAVRAEAWGQSMLLIAVSGFTRPEDRFAALYAGFDHFFPKPCSLDDVLEALPIDCRIAEDSILRLGNPPGFA